MDQYLEVNTMPAMLPVQVMDKYSFTRGICANSKVSACRHWKGVLNAMRRS